MGVWTKDSLGGIEPYRPGRRASDVRRELGLSAVIKLSSNESSLPPVAKAVLAMTKALSGVNRYPDGACSRLKGRLSQELGVGLDTLMIGNGSNELIRLLAQVVLEPGDEVVMAAPSFIVYPIVAAIMGARAVQVPLKNHVHDLVAMAAVVTKKTKLVFVCNPNNPTGTIVTAGAVRDFLKQIPEEVLVCFDEAYHEFVMDDAYISAMDLLSDYRNLIVLRTFSKIYGLAGARVGYGVAPPEVVEAVDKVREPFNVNLIGQIGAYWSLDARPEIERRRRVNAGQKALVEAALSRLGFEYAPSEANFVYFNPGMPVSEAYAKLKRQGVIVRAFRDGDFIRATLGSPSENRRLVKALEAL